MILILKILNLFLIYPVCVYTLFSRMNFKSDYKVPLSMALSIILVSWLYIFLLRVFPHKQDWFYLLSISLFFILSIPRFIHFKRYCEEVYSFKCKLKLDEKIYLLCMFSAIGFIFLWFIVRPLIANDPLEYFYLSSVINDLKDVSFYPSVSAVNERGLIVPWTHPLGYPGILAWARLGLLASQGFFLAKVLSAYFMFLLLFIIYLIERKESTRPFLVTALLLLLTPICFQHLLECHVDSARVVTFFIPLLLIWERFLEKKRPFCSQDEAKFITILAIFCGLSWFFHSSGILTIFFSSITYVFFYFLRYWNAKSYKKFFVTLVKYGILFFSISLMIVMFDLYNNYKVHGNIIGDMNNIPVIKILKDEYEHYYNLDRNVLNIRDAIFYGLGATFTKLSIFGVVYWVFLLSICSSLTGLWKKRLLTKTVEFSEFSALLVMAFFSMVFLTLFFGIKTFAINPRYLLQIHPFICVASGSFLRKVLR